MNSQLNSQALLQVKDFCVSYGAIQALRGIGFEIYRGEIVSLIGSNGAGKTTTLRALSGLLPYRGHVHLNGKSLSGLKPEKMVKLGMIQSPEGRGIFPNLNVEENLLMGAYTRRDGAEIQRDLERYYDLFPKLRERRKQLAGTLSGGEQQMLAMSRALMARPKLLMLDEPSLGLAPKIVSQIFSIVVQLNQEGMTILLVEQNAHLALKVSHRAYVLETGEIKLSGTGQELSLNEDVRKSYLGG